MAKRKKPDGTKFLRYTTGGDQMHKLLAVLLAGLALSSHAGSGVPLMGFTTGDTMAETGPKAAALRQQGYNASFATETASQRQVGAAFFKPGFGVIGFDRLIVINDDLSQQVKALYREEGFADDRRPLLDVFYGSIQGKFGLGRGINRVIEEGMWVVGLTGPTFVQDCLEGTPRYTQHYQVRYGSQYANLNIVDPRRIRLNADGTAKCQLAYVLQTVTAGSPSGMVVSSYNITAVDLRLLVRDTRSAERRSDEQGKIARDKAIKASPKPNF